MVLLSDLKVCVLLQHRKLRASFLQPAAREEHGRRCHPARLWFRERPLCLQPDDRNNKDLLDDGSAQTLTDAEINKMKRSGLSGEEIVKAIAAASATLSSKTAFSQVRRACSQQAAPARVQPALPLKHTWVVLPYFETPH